MTTLAVFTVKLFHKSGGEYYTFGGFGDQLGAILPYFDKTILVAHVKSAAPPTGYYPVASPRLEIVGLPPTVGELQVLKSIPTMYRIARQVVQRANLVATRMPDYTGVMGGLAARHCRVPYFAQIIDDWALQARQLDWRKKRGLGLVLKAHLLIYDWFERRISREQLVFAQGQSCYLKHRDSSDCKLVVSAAHHDVDVVDTPPWRFTSTPPRIVNVARLNSVKNQQLIIQAILALKAVGRKWELVLVGDGPQRHYLEAIARQYELGDQVQFTGLIEHGKALWRLYDSSDVFVLSSLSEGTPKVILEAMARGVPVVASAVAGVPTVVQHEVNGLLFASGDLQSLVSHLLRLESDAALRDRLVGGGLRTAREFTVEAETRRLMGRVFSKWPHLKDPTEIAKQEIHD
jgi:glycosyltransferase involved in cell wall biosynthesis